MLMMIGFACISVLAPAMLSEIVDYSTWKFGVERSATYFSCFTFIVKTSDAMASALGLGIVGWYGYDATATQHGSETVFGLSLAISWLPCLLILMGAGFIALYPITTDRHAVIRRRLEINAGRLSNTPPLAAKITDTESSPLAYTKAPLSAAKRSV